MQTPKNNKRIYLARVLLTLACVLLLAFIFGNSLIEGDESDNQSNIVVKVVQKVVGFFAPKSWIATATGEDYQRLHAIVRTLAHFSEFALLGALCSWCYRAYTSQKTYFFAVVFFVAYVPIIDEFLQSFTIGRVADIHDVWVDTLGAFAGILFALGTLWLAKIIIKRREKVARIRSGSNQIQ